MLPGQGRNLGERGQQGEADSSRKGRLPGSGWAGPPPARRQQAAREPAPSSKSTLPLMWRQNSLETAGSGRAGKDRRSRQSASISQRLTPQVILCPGQVSECVQGPYLLWEGSCYSRKKQGFAVRWVPVLALWASKPRERTYDPSPGLLGGLYGF